MLISFKDIDGVPGVITADLEVDYQARWEREVRACVNGLKEEVVSDENEEHITAFVNNLMLDLPEVAPLQEIELRPNEEISVKR